MSKWQREVFIMPANLQSESELIHSLEQTMTAWIYTPQSADGITFAADGQATITVEQFELNL